MNVTWVFSENGMVTGFLWCWRLILGVDTITVMCNLSRAFDGMVSRVVRGCHQRMMFRWCFIGSRESGGGGC